MPASDQKLIERLQERNADRERATDGGIHSRKPSPPVAAIALEAAERAIGLKLPELLRVIYRSEGPTTNRVPVPVHWRHESRD